MATLTVQAAAESGGISFTAASGGGDVFANGSRVLLVIANGDVSAKTVTVTAQSTSATKEGYGTVTKANAVQSVEAGTTDIMGPFPASAFNNSSGQCAVTYSDVTSVTVAVISIP